MKKFGVPVRAAGVLCALVVSFAGASPAVASASSSRSHASLPAADALPRYALPQPVLTLTGISVRDSFIEAHLSVSNYAAYPDFLFEHAPGLPPCGLNTNASRTWVDIYDGQTGQRIYSFCGFTRAQDLTSLWFARPVTTGLPHSLYIRLVDRMAGDWSQSNTVNIP